MSGWDQRHDLEDDDRDALERDGRLWWMVGVTALAVLVAIGVWVLL